MNILTETLEQGYNFDRYPDEILSLPYDINQILIQPNDTVNSDVINLKLQHLHDNFLYLFSKTRISSNLIPVTSTGMLGCSGNNLESFNWYTNLSSSMYTDASNQLTLEAGSYLTLESGNTFLLEIGQSIDADYATSLNSINTVYALNNDTNGMYTIFGGASSSLFLFKSYSDDSRLLTTQRITAFNAEQNNNVPFQNIVAIAAGPANTILVLDRKANALYQYDGSGFNTDNNVLLNRLVLLNVVGELGDINEKLSFDAPADVVTYNNEVYVLDAGNSCIKKYDQFLNWRQTFDLSRDFYLQQPQKLKVDAYGNFYCLLSGNTFYKYNNNFQNKTLHVIDYVQSETVQDLIFSQTENNIFYVLTNRNVYKCMVNNLGNTIGKYLLYNFRYNDAQSMMAFTTLPQGSNDKNLLVSKNSAGAQIIGSFQDNLNLYDNLTLSAFDIYGFQDIQVNSEEYFQNWTINKSVAKLIANHIRLIEQLIGKFQFKIDNQGNSTFAFTKYLTDTEKQNLIAQTEAIL